ncbi:LuxR C-terminal-related transcriptional regulator [Dietzia sp.]|uniref:LuxR C-terminal-related transcriptional regulator n=1 Tax=Dietzia sp. TaxID=1871616 RepID=UPI002FDB0D58
MSETRTSHSAGLRRKRDSDRAAIRAALDELRKRTGVPLVAGGYVGENKTLHVCEAHGLSTLQDIDVEVAPGVGVGGRIVATGKPFGVTEYLRSGVISHEFDELVRTEGVRSVAAIPAIVGDSVRAVLYVAMRTNVRFGEKSLAEMTAVGRRLEQHLAVADALEGNNAGRGLGARAARGSLSAGVGGSLGGAAHAEGDTAVPEFDAALVHERMRETHAKLRVLSSRTEDPLTRMELESIAADLVAPSSQVSAAKLARRELDVLACVAQGKTNIETGQIMGIGAETVKSYLRSAMRKLDAHTRYEAVNAARRIGALP